MNIESFSINNKNRRYSIDDLKWSELEVILHVLDAGSGQCNVSIQESLLVREIIKKARKVKKTKIWRATIKTNKSGVLCLE